MKKNCVLWMFAMLMLAVGMSSCSSDDEDNIVPQINTANGTIEDFFNTEFPVTHDSFEYSNSHSFFCEEKSGIKSAITENIVCVINSRKELADIYLGEKEIPEIDFEKNTLIIGQQIMPCLGFYVAKKELLADDDGLVLTLYAKNDLVNLPLALMNLYYWELYPKLSQKNISVNVIKEYTNRPDLQ